MAKAREALRVCLGACLTLLMVAANTSFAVSQVPKPHDAPAATLKLVESVRRSLERETLTEAITAVASSAGLREKPAPRRPVSVANVTSLPTGLREVTRGLLEAVATAEWWADSAFESRVDSETLWTEAVSGFRSRFEDGRLTSAEVDQDALYSGSLALARAIDKALPKLRTYAARQPSEGSVVEGCDVLDLVPALCVGSGEANIYKHDVALLIDLGGADRHLHSAGGADPGVVGDSGNGLPVAVTIDVGGDDVYKAVSPTPSGGRIFHGGGFAGGIGFLVDAAGNDRYHAISRKPFPESLGVPAQGFAVIGGGVLADLAGQDRYHLDHRSRLDMAQAALGGGGAGEGIGLQLDFGGDDSYRAADRPLPFRDGEGVVHPGIGTVIAYGAAAAGPGVFWDSGGNDALTIRADTVTPPARTESASTTVFAEGFGFEGLDGLALALTGPGPTRWSLSSETASQEPTSVAYGFGQGNIGGFAAASDAGGPDSYLLSASARGPRASTIDAASKPSSAVVLAFGMGMGNAGAVGLQHDLAGDDRYDVKVLSTGETAFAQGSTQAYGTLEGVGHLLDEAGDDSYSSSVTVSAPTKDAIGNVLVGAQAAAQLGTAVFRDLEGNDRYAAMAHALVPGSSSLEGVSYTAGAQGSVELLGTAIFLDGGGRDRYKSSPPDKPCLGTRGQGVWSDCGSGFGLGLDRT